MLNDLSQFYLNKEKDFSHEKNCLVVGETASCCHAAESRSATYFLTGEL